MSHVRQQIREYIVGQLNSVVGNRAYPYRTISHRTLPDIVVYTTQDEVLHDEDADGKNFRELTVEVEIRDKALDDIDDRLDALSVQVEKKLAADTRLGGLSYKTELDTTDIELEGESDQAVGLATLTYAVWYRTAESDPETAL